VDPAPQRAAPEPAFAALASSVRDLGELVEMRAQLHRAIVARDEEGEGGDQEGALRDLRAAFTRYAAAQSAPPAQLAAALGGFERDAPGTDAREAHRSGDGLGNLLMDELAVERAGPAALPSDWRRSAAGRCGWSTR